MDAEELLEKYAAGERKFHSVNLSQENLKGADLTEIDLTNANLTGVDLSGANLTKAKLNSTNLTKRLYRYKVKFSECFFSNILLDRPQWC